MNAHLYNANEKRVWLRELGSYDRHIGPDGRARTIAALHVAQNRSELKATALRADMVRYLLGPSAYSYWLKIGRLESVGQDERGFRTLRLTDQGLLECANSASGGGNIPTTTARIQKWIQAILTYDPDANGKFFDV